MRTFYKICTMGKVTDKCIEVYTFTINTPVSGKVGIYEPITYIITNKVSKVRGVAYV